VSRPAVAEWLPPALRDAPEGDAGAPRLLDALLDAVEAQRRLLEQDIDRLWDDLFIESCADWAVPYIGSLLGLPADSGRLEVAYAIALRRRKGTPAALEDFAEVLTDWSVRVLEGWQITVWSQRLGHPPPPRIASFDLRDGSRFRVGTPFERGRRSFTPGKAWSPRAATAVVWPWKVRTYLETEAAPLSGSRFSLHPLAAEAPLYLLPRPRRLSSDVGASAGRSRTGDELDAPVRATYRVFEALAAEGQIGYGVNWKVDPQHPLAAGSGTSTPTLLTLTVDGTPVPWNRLRFGALPPGAPAPAPPTANQAVVDLARGHVELGSNLTGTPRATWHRPVPGELGALAGDGVVDPAARVVIEVRPEAPAEVGNIVKTLSKAFSQGELLSAGLSPDDSSPEHPDVEIRLLTSDRLKAPPAQTFTPTLPRWRVVAPRPQTPTVDGTLSLNLTGACVTVEGFSLDGNLNVGKDLDCLHVRHVTMNTAAGREVQVAAGGWGVCFQAELSILGALRADLAALPLSLSDCIVDGRGEALRVCGGPSGGSTKDGVRGTTTTSFRPALRADGCTFAGAVRLEAVDAIDCVFLDGVEAVQTQEGCLRHCYLGPDLSTPAARPPTYRCGPFPAPTFASVGFEAAGYYALELEPDHPLLSAASDGGEVGAYHHARRAARIGSLRRRIHEFVPLGLRAGVSLAPWEE
jgi:hypothetical protein